MSKLMEHQVTKPQSKCLLWIYSSPWFPYTHPIIYRKEFLLGKQYSIWLKLSRSNFSWSKILINQLITIQHPHQIIYEAMAYCCGNSQVILQKEKKDVKQRICSVAGFLPSSPPLGSQELNLQRIVLHDTSFDYMYVHLYRVFALLKSDHRLTFV